MTNETFYTTMSEMLSGARTKAEILAFLSERSDSKKSVDELATYLRAIRDTAQFTVDADQHDLPIVDLSGTGGDQQRTVNISTLAALVAASTGQVFVYKYGNRSASGLCGSMDALEAVGIDIDLSPEEFLQADKTLNFAPIFARMAYPGAKHVAEARKEFGRPSLFNLLFPLARPIKGTFSFVMGFAKPEDIPLAAQIIQPESVRALLVHGQDGTDEISISGNGITDYTYISNGTLQTGTLNIEELFGITPIDLSELQIIDRQDAIELFISVLDPSNTSPRVETIRKAVLVNAAAALSVAQPHSEDLKKNLVQSYLYVEQALNEGLTQQLLKKLQNRNYAK